MKKTITVLLSLLLCLSLLALPAYADGETYSEGYFYYTVQDQAITITGYFGREEEVTVPSSIAGAPVSRIASGAFLNTTVRILHLPGTIMTIEEGAISGATIVWDSAPPSVVVAASPSPSPAASASPSPTVSASPSPGPAVISQTPGSEADDGTEDPVVIIVGGADEPVTTENVGATDPTSGIESVMGVEPPSPTPGSTAAAPLSSTAPASPTPTAPPAPAAEPESSPTATDATSVGGTNHTAPLLVVLVLAACGCGYWFVRKKKGTGKNEAE